MVDNISTVYYRPFRKVTKTNGAFYYASGRLINLNGRLRHLFPANGGVLTRQTIYPV